MRRIAIFRQAKKEQVSSLQHLIQRNDRFNSDPKINPNFDNENYLIYYDNNKGYSLGYKRNGQNNRNDTIINKIISIENNLDKLAREDYKNHKLAEKAKNPNKKVRTILQSKNLKREFIIAFGGDNKKIAFKTTQDIYDFVSKMLKAKGLDNKNLICATYHNDEKEPHLHVQYNCYSFDNHTTEIELEKRSIKELAKTKEFNSQYDAVRENFSKWQDKTVQILNEIGVECVRGEKDSKRKNISKFQHLEEEIKKRQAELLQLQKINEELTSKQSMIDKLNATIEKLKLNKDAYQKLADSKMKEYTEASKKSSDAVVEKNKLINEINDLKTKIKPIAQLQDELAKEFDHRVSSIMDLWEYKDKKFIDSRVEDAKKTITEKYTEQVKKIVNQDIDF